MPVAAEIKVLSGGAMRGRSWSTPCRCSSARAAARSQVSFALTSALKKEIEDGAAFDIALLPRPEARCAGAGRQDRGRHADRHHALGRRSCGARRRAEARHRHGRRVQARAARRRNRSPTATGRAAPISRACWSASASRREMKPKTRLTSGPVAELVASGEAEIGMQQIVAILPVKGAELVGPLPRELQNIIVYAAGLSAGAGDTLARRAPSSRFMATPRSARASSAPRAWSRGERRGPAETRRCACAIAFSCPYRLDLGRWRRYIRPLFGRR